MKTKFIYALSALMMVVMMFATSCEKDDPIEPTPSATYTITFNANGGAGTMTAQKVTEANSTPLKVNAYTYANHTFTGWNTKSDGSGTSYADKSKITLTANLTLYAQWIADAAITYTVTFNAPGCVGTMEQQIVEKNKETPLTANIYTRTNYTFSGWNTKSDGSGTSYADKSSVKLTADLTLYAQWKVAVVAVTGVTLNKSTLTLGEGETEALVATVNPSNATNKKVTWKSSNTAVATASNGVVKAITAGTATITVTSEDGSKSATCVVTVTEPFSFADDAEIGIKGMNGTPDSYTLASLRTITLSIYRYWDMNPYNYHKTQWSTFDPSIVSISNKEGSEVVITALKPGITTITATDEMGHELRIVIIVHKPIQVGDFYYGGTIFSSELDKSKSLQGVVYETDGQNGKVISATTFYFCTWGPSESLSQYSFSPTNGRVNMNIILSRSNAEDYDAFDKIDSRNLPNTIYNADAKYIWYLPATDELDVLRNNQELLDKVQASMKIAGGDEITSVVEYWSSTNNSINSAIAVKLDPTWRVNYREKNTKNWVVGIMAF